MHLNGTEVLCRKMLPAFLPQQSGHMDAASSCGFRCAQRKSVHACIPPSQCRPYLSPWRQLAQHTKNCLRLGQNLFFKGKR